MFSSSCIRFSVSLYPRVVILGVTGCIAGGKSVRCRHLLRLSEARARQPVNSFTVHSINADKTGHNIYAPGKPCYYKVIEAFGKDILEEPLTCEHSNRDITIDKDILGDLGNVSSSINNNNNNNNNNNSNIERPIDRRKLSKLVFHEPRSKELKLLSDICWPHIHDAVEQEIETASHNALATKKNVLFIILEAALLIESSMLRLCDDVWITTCERNVAVRRVMERHCVNESQAIARVEAQPTLEEKLGFLSDVKFKGGVLTFDTTHDTVDEGLRRVTISFDEYWRRKLKPLQKDPGAETGSWNPG